MAGGNIINIRTVNRTHAELHQLLSAVPATPQTGFSSIRLLMTYSARTIATMCTMYRNQSERFLREAELKKKCCHHSFECVTDGQRGRFFSDDFFCILFCLRALFQILNKIKEGVREYTSYKLHRNIFFILLRVKD